MASGDSRRRLLALQVTQWMPEWDEVDYADDERRRRPHPYFYVAAMPASDLKALAGIQRRSTSAGKLRAEDLGIQRRHDPERSAEIRDYVRYGYPWSELTKSQRSSGQFADLRKPGWLPTAIVANVLIPTDVRQGEPVAEPDLVAIHDNSDGTASVLLPSSFDAKSWKPSGPFPIEIIDGQHRLWAFTQSDDTSTYLLPVVLFHGLDVSWQAYLFWTINIRPKRINASLAFDLYPLLRSEDWLDRFAGHSIYRETRAQELVEALWASPESPWHQRINMLGEPGRGEVRQAAWVRSLVATYVKRWEGPGIAIGGLFGPPLDTDRPLLPWSGAQQAAFLIYAWQAIEEAVAGSSADWAQALRGNTERPSQADAAFSGPETLLNTDPGVRGVLYVTNDLPWVRGQELDLLSWTANADVRPSDLTAVEAAVESLKTHRAGEYLRAIAESFASFDWRTSTAPGLSDEQRVQKLAIRGSGGYRELRRLLLEHLVATAREDVAAAARVAYRLLGFQ